MAFLLALPPKFSFEATVLSHGWVFLPPFAWDGTTLQVPLEADETARGSATVRIESVSGRRLRVHGPARTPRAATEAAVRWMLRVDEDFAALDRIARMDTLVRAARRRGAGRLLRAPSVWEEAVRVLCTTNISWSGTIRMMTGLVALGGGRFPTPRQILHLPGDRLRRDAGLGYRVEALRELAERVIAGLDLEAWKSNPPERDALEAEIGAWRGFGPYATAHLLVQLGHYHRLPIDSEVVAFHREQGLPAEPAAIAAHYAQYGDHAFLIYKLRRIALRRNWIGEPH